MDGAARYSPEAYTFHTVMAREQDEEYEREIATGANLKPPLRVRDVYPHVCATCRFFVMGPGYSGCKRPNGPGFDNGDMAFYFKTCDRWTDGAA